MLVRREERGGVEQKTGEQKEKRRSRHEKRIPPDEMCVRLALEKGRDSCA